MGHRFGEEEERVLAAGGLGADRAPPRDSDPAADRAAAERARVLSGSLDVRGAANVLGVGEDAVRQRIAEGTLYALWTEGDHRLLAFQFGGGGEVPGIGGVLRCVDRSQHPVGVVNWFTLPDPDLYLDPEEETPVSPRNWLLAGGDPDVLVLQARHLGEIP